MLDYCYLVNPYFPSDRMKDELRANFDELLVQYPSGMYVNSLIAGKCFGVRQEYIVPGTGAAELIKSLMENTPGKRLGVIYPTFEEYPNRKAKEDIVVFVPDTEDFHYTVDDLIGCFSSNPVDILLLINPDNPSGNYIPVQDIFRLADWCSARSIRLIVDESFVDFSSDFPGNSLLNNSILERYPGLTVVKSISKSFGVPGLRLGVLASSDPDVVSSVRKDVSIWNINSFAEFFMQIYTKYEADYIRSAEKFRAERKRFYDDLKTIPFLKVFESEANYFLCEVLPPYTSQTLAVRLLKEFNILIKDCAGKKAFNGRDFVRLAVRNSADNHRLVESLRTLEK